ncbi:anhydro-N-acetylmuramic acid kinase [Lysobacter olei]
MTVHAGPVRNAATGPRFFIGLMSGTSADGIDAALVRFDDGAAAPHGTLVLGRTHPWTPELRDRLVAIGQGARINSLDEVGTLDVRIGDAFAKAAIQLLAEAGVAADAVTAIGSHGQTLRHRPAGAAFDGCHPFTLQLGDGNVIAERTGITTVADFRRRDVAAGGQGAPLVPAFHAALLHAVDEDRAVLNLGGIGNFTLLPASGTVRGFDTGPANALMDAWCQRQFGIPFDHDGTIAAGGVVDRGLLDRLLDESWFSLPPPKSTGREQFHLDWVDAQRRGGERAEDVQATLLELTAVTVCQALRREQPTTRRVLVCGGGVRNPSLMARIEQLLGGTPVQSTAAFGLDPDYVEAMAFAWLARQTLAGAPGNLPAVTGARGPRVLGAIYPA